MAAIEQVRQPQISGGGGPVTKDRYSGDNSSTWARGQLLKLASGVLADVVSGATEIDSSADLTAATKLFIALDALAVASSDKQPVQRILTSTRFRGPLISSAAATTPPTAPESIIGTQYQLLQDANGNFAVDKNTASTNPVVEITNVEAESDPWFSPDLYKNALGVRHVFVEFKFLTTVVSDV